MTKTYLPGIVLGGFLAVVLALAPQLAVHEPSQLRPTAVASIDPLSPALVNPYIEKDVQETHPKAPVPEGERAYATLEVEPQTAGERFPVVRTRFREPSSPAGQSDVTRIEMLPTRREDPGG